jgi:hypothetical protein
MVSIIRSVFLPVIYQAKKKISQVLVLLWGGGGGQLFSPNPRREKNYKNSCRDVKNCGHLVQPVQLFEST